VLLTPIKYALIRVDNRVIPPVLTFNDALNTRTVPLTEIAPDNVSVLVPDII
jgi:hypothetical protein